MTWDGVERRTEPRAAPMETGSTLSARLDALNTNVERLANVVDENTKALSRLAVLEANHNGHSQAIERAFKAIEKHGESVEAMEAKYDKIVEAAKSEHRTYDKWIWTMSGFCAAICAIWTVIGYRMNAMIDDQVRAVTEMRMHIHDDKVTTPEQVRSIMGVGDGQLRH